MLLKIQCSTGNPYLEWAIKFDSPRSFKSVLFQDPYIYTGGTYYNTSLNCYNCLLYAKITNNPSAVRIDSKYIVLQNFVTTDSYTLRRAAITATNDLLYCASSNPATVNS